MRFTLTVLKLVVSGLFLGYASLKDVEKREVENKVWVFYGPLGLILTLIEGFIFNEANYWVSSLISIVFTWGLVIALFYAGAFGGADAKAFMCLALTLPTYPNLPLETPYPSLHGFFPITVFTNSVLLAALSVIYMLLRNLFWKAYRRQKLFEGLENESFWKKMLVVLCGYKVPLRTVDEKDYYFPLEDVDESEDRIERFIVVFPSDEERVEVLARLKYYIGKSGVNEHVWASPGLPMLVFVTLGFVIALFFGDLVWFTISFLLTGHLV